MGGFIENLNRHRLTKKQVAVPGREVVSTAQAREGEEGGWGVCFPRVFPRRGRGKAEKRREMGLTGMAHRLSYAFPLETYVGTYLTER